MTEPDPTPTLRFDRKAMRRMRLEHRISHENLARRLGTSPTSPLVADWEAGWSAPQLRNIGRLARALGCAPADR